MYTVFKIIHSSTWFFLLLLFFLSYFLRNKKVTLMLLRLAAVLMVVSGVGLLVSLQFPGHYIVKGILAILLIAVMEMLIGRQKRGQSTGVFWVINIILIVLVVLMGFSG